MGYRNRFYCFLKQQSLKLMPVTINISLDGNRFLFSDLISRLCYLFILFLDVSFVWPIFCAWPEFAFQLAYNIFYRGTSMMIWNFQFIVNTILGCLRWNGNFTSLAFLILARTDSWLGLLCQERIKSLVDWQKRILMLIESNQVYYRELF